MPGAMEESQTRRPSEPLVDRSARFFDETLGRINPPVPRGSREPGPAATVTTAAGGSKKKHIKKLEDFTNVKDWDKFKRQEFLYYEEYENEFTNDATHIRFDPSFFVGGLPEKFTANFIDQIINDTVLRWGTFRAFCR